ncbi:MAG: hypothetical protein LBR11_04130 [Deltaproteobacteria bacterium]|jgi:hypothetical protein|nr:hypothetical protein [Deltaproteobacteria bacterium]
MKYIVHKIVLFLAVGVFFGLTGGSVGWAQNSLGPPLESPGAAGRESLHLNTIGTYSAGFVLQSYGYIGVLADVMSQGVYEPEMVRGMLKETITFLRNANQQLSLYQDKTLRFSQADQRFIDGINSIINDLINEAEALSAFAESRKEEDLQRFETSRKKAWSGIKKTLGVN